jgi:hypothetical protein
MKTVSRRLTAGAVALAFLAGAPVLSAKEPSPVFDLLPLELTAFGDIRYRRSNGEHGFAIGSFELDSALELSKEVLVSAAIAYDPEADVTRLAAFTVDGALLGSDSNNLFRSDAVVTAGLVFGKFDVPFGIAYLEYAATDGRFLFSPSIVRATHDGWNDLGAQAYAIGETYNAVVYLVNGSSLAGAEPVADLRPSYAAGGRLGLKPFPSLEFGGSVAEHLGSARRRLFGADLAFASGPFEIKNEYIADQSDGSSAIHGFYSQGLCHYGPLFGGVRYDAVLQELALERSATLTLGAEVFKDAEIRVVQARGFGHSDHSIFVQLVGGSAWQPTGVRR